MRSAQGFTLVEILVSLTLFAVVGGALLQLYHDGLKGARIAEERSHAALLARSLLTELQAYASLTPGTLSGRFDDGYHWQATLTRSADPADTAGRSLFPLDLDLTIRWGDAADSQSLQIDSLLITREPPL